MGLERRKAEHFLLGSLLVRSSESHCIQPSVLSALYARRKYRLQASPREEVCIYGHVLMTRYQEGMLIGIILTVLTGVGRPVY